MFMGNQITVIVYKIRETTRGDTLHPDVFPMSFFHAGESVHQIHTHGQQVELQYPSA